LVNFTPSASSGAGDLLVEVLGQHVDLVLVVRGLREQLELAMVWLVNEFDITKLGGGGCPG